MANVKVKSKGNQFEVLSGLDSNNMGEIQTSFRSRVLKNSNSLSHDRKGTTPPDPEDGFKGTTSPDKTPAIEFKGPTVSAQTLESDFSQEERRFEGKALEALDKAKQGRSPLNKEELAVVIDWLAWYRKASLSSEEEESSSGDETTSVEGGNSPPAEVEEFSGTRGDSNEVDIKVETGGSVNADSEVGEALGSASVQVSCPILDSTVYGVSLDCDRITNVDLERRIGSKEIQIGDNRGELIYADQVFDKLPSSDIHLPLGVFTSGGAVNTCAMVVSGSGEHVGTGEGVVGFNKGCADSPKGDKGVLLSSAHQVLDERCHPRGSPSRDTVVVDPKLHQTKLSYKDAVKKQGNIPSASATQSKAEGIQQEHFRPKSWASITSNFGQPGIKLDQIDIDNCLDFVDIEDYLVDEESWENCAVGYFLGNDMVFGIVRATARKLWGHLGLVDVFGTDKGFYFFRFHSMEAMENVLDNGPWHFSGRPLMLRKWKKCLRLSKENHSKIPVWVKLHDLPLEFWNAPCLSRIASFLGAPLYVDKATNEKRRISYARVCVDIDATKVLKKNIKIRCGGEMVEVQVEYQGLPSLCLQCQVFGHDMSHCKEGKRGRDNEDSREEGSQEGKEFESDLDSSVSSEWVRVKRRRNAKKKKVQGPRQHMQSRPRVSSFGQPFAQLHRSPRPDSRHRSYATVQAGAQPSRPAPSVALVGGSVPPQSPASRASMLLQAVDGAGQLGYDLGYFA